VAAVDPGKDGYARRGRVRFDHLPQPLGAGVVVAHRSPEQQARARVEHAGLLQVGEVRVDVGGRGSFLRRLEEEDRALCG
jgi:hypothetical protein